LLKGPEEGRGPSGERMCISGWRRAWVRRKRASHLSLRESERERRVRSAFRVKARLIWRRLTWRPYGSGGCNLSEKRKEKRREGGLKSGRRRAKSKGCCIEQGKEDCAYRQGLEQLEEPGLLHSILRSEEVHPGREEERKVSFALDRPSSSRPLPTSSFPEVPQSQNYESSYSPREEIWLLVILLPYRDVLFRSDSSHDPFSFLLGGGQIRQLLSVEAERFLLSDELFSSLKVSHEGRRGSGHLGL